ncbi:MAG TPA: class I SAM-dependent methyltransferase [Stellaceae bacterium]|jgi:SAM-dependent methyltransferase
MPRLHGLGAHLPAPIRAIVEAPVRRFRKLIGYNRLHVRQAWKLARAPSTVLVVGANVGEDCRRFADLGAKEIHGIDVIENVGADFRDVRTVYHRASIEACDLPDDRFDLVFATATMEHVHNIEAGFAEMARVTKPGGFLWSIASPLWRSPYGHHMPCFNGHPWVHLLYDETALQDYAREHGITRPEIDRTISYMFDPIPFNRRPAKDYAAAVANLRAVQIIANDLYRIDSSLLAHPLGRRALANGFEEDELLSETHYAAARRL